MNNVQVDSLKLDWVLGVVNPPTHVELDVSTAVDTSKKLISNEDLYGLLVNNLKLEDFPAGKLTPKDLLFFVEIYEVARKIYASNINLTDFRSCDIVDDVVHNLQITRGNKKVGRYSENLLTFIIETAVEDEFQAQQNLEA